MLPPPSLLVLRSGAPPSALPLQGRRRRRRSPMPVRASWQELAGVLVFSAIPFTAVKALANSPLSARLRRRLEDRKAAAAAEADALRAAARGARNNSFWYGGDRPRWLGPVPYEYPEHLTGEYPGDDGFDVAGLGRDPVAFANYFNFEILHCRWAMLAALGVVIPELLDLFGLVHFVEPVWWKVGYAKLQGDTLDYLGIPGFRIAGGQGVIVIAICQALLMNCSMEIYWPCKKLPHWDLGDRTGGCSRNTPLDCNANTGSISTDVFHPIPLVTLPYGPQSLQTMTRSECQRACLSNCSCTAYSYQDTECSVWHGKLFNVNKDDGIEISSEDSIYIRVAAGDFPSLTRGTTRKPVPVGAITAASVIGSVVLLIVIVISRKKYWCGCGVSSPAPTSEASVGVAVFSYADLSRATRNFSEKLGAGGFGSVYKGVISGLSTVAVKRLDGVRQGEKQFRAEVSALGLIQHINLVKLVGFCCQGDKRLLVYEHMCNGSLDYHLFERNDATAVLDWNTRYQIAVGVARGLSYLHQSCRECIIHCDIKPENILLDESFVPKIADFGLASVIGRDFSRVLTTFKGTMGYLAPEWLSGVPITSKVDVYSFGMVLMEIISGTRNASVVYNTSSSMDDHVAYFPVLAMSQLREGDVQSLVDPNLHENFSLEEAERICKVACWCIQDNESDRPTMGEVVRVLDGLQDLYIPPMPRLLAAITERSSVVAM